MSLPQRHSLTTHLPPHPSIVLLPRAARNTTVSPETKVLPAPLPGGPSPATSFRPQDCPDPSPLSHLLNTHDLLELCLKLAGLAPTGTPGVTGLVERLGPFSASSAHPQGAFPGVTIPQGTCETRMASMTSPKLTALRAPVTRGATLQGVPATSVYSRNSPGRAGLV